jgi:hypothetical protein
MATTSALPASTPLPHSLLSEMPVDKYRGAVVEVSLQCYNSVGVY